MPRILIGVPEFNSCGIAVVTVIRALGTVPFPDITLVITIGSALNAPTISHSGALLEKDVEEFGNFEEFSISL